VRAALWVWLFVLTLAPVAIAQGFDATDLRQPTELATGWLVQAGDDPAYADPHFDDSHWHHFNAATDSLHTLFPNAKPGVFWYRLHIRVAPNDTGLALQEYFTSSAFDLYSNGVRVLQVGQVAPFVPADYLARLFVVIPADQIASGTLILALRVHITAEEWSNAFPGYYGNNLILGQRDAIHDLIWLRTIGAHALPWLDLFAGFFLTLGAALLYSAQRRNREYLFVALWGLAALLPTPLDLYSEFHTFPRWWHFINAISDAFTPYLLGRTYFAFLNRPVGRLMRGFLIAAGCIGFAGGASDALGNSNLVMDIVTSLPSILLISVILPAILIGQMRRGNREAGILLLPLIVLATYYYLNLGSIALSQIPALRAPAWSVHQFTQSMNVGPFAVSMEYVASILSILALSLIILLRSNRLSRSQAVMEGELAAAREVQQVIVPAQDEGVPGFAVESVYRPAQQVGGDFFQIVPTGEGGLILVIGDVAGKGLPAAMLVSVLVGAIRTATSYTHEPEEILAQLNARLLGRTQGSFSTALAARIDADGSVKIANAGHLSPYLDGKEFELPGALPLGIAEGIRYEPKYFRLLPGSRLTFYSDGVIEAQSTDGALFGFELGRELSTQPAASIVDAAVAHGQSDDITVVTIRRDLAIASAA
jgi:phosphoserine phosphatase RsbU/P